MEVDEDGKLRGCTEDVAGNVETRGEASADVDNNVPGGDAGGGVRAGVDPACAHEAVHAAALVADEVRRHVVVHLVVWIHGQRPRAGKPIAEGSQDWTSVCDEASSMPFNPCPSCERECDCETHDCTES